MENIEKLAQKIEHLRQIDQKLSLITNLAQQVAEDRCETDVILKIFKRTEATQDQKQANFDEDGSLILDEYINNISYSGPFHFVIGGNQTSPQEKIKQQHTEHLPLTPTLTLKILQLYLGELKTERANLVQQIKGFQQNIK